MIPVQSLKKQDAREEIKPLVDVSFTPFSTSQRIVVFESYFSIEGTGQVGW